MDSSIDGNLLVYSRNNVISKPRFLNNTKACWLLLPIYISFVNTASACYSPPDEHDISLDEQIKSAHQVSVSKVVNIAVLSEGKIRYSFSVQEMLAGPELRNFSVIVQGRASDDDHVSVTDHSVKRFWEHGGGRLVTDGDCQFRPTFRLNENYLIFGGTPLNRRSLEHLQRIDDKFNYEDKWLKYVKTNLPKANK